MNKILIKNVRIPYLSDRRIHRLDILFSQPQKAERGKIIEIAPKIECPNAKVIEGEGDYILPAFIDLCADIYHPDNRDRETITSGSLAALRGGYSDILIKDKGMPVSEIQAHCNIHVCRQYNDTADSGLVYAEKTDVKALRDLMLDIKEKNSLLFLSPEADPLYPNSCITEGQTSRLLHLPCEPASVEARRISEFLILAEETGCNIHLRNISTKKSIELIRQAKKDGVALTCSTSPHYFSFNAEDMIFIGSNAKVYPPLRENRDRAAVIEGLADGTIDCIDSGHTPCTRQEKGTKIIDASYGAIGLQSSFSALVTYLLLPGYIDIYRLCELMYLNPGRILGIDVKKEFSTEVTAFNLASISNEFIFSESYLKGKSVNSPFINMSLCGNIRETYIL